MTQKTYKVTMIDGTQTTVTGARMEQDGSGTRVFDADGEVVAFWYMDVKSVQRTDSCEDTTPAVAPEAPAADPEAA